MAKQKEQPQGEVRLKLYGQPLRTFQLEGTPEHIYNVADKIRTFYAHITESIEIDLPKDSE